ncbi:MAG: 5'/3'-nucleotidase SurE [Anaerolineae bacterium]
MIQASTRKRPLILLTNDDGIGSPGLWELARAVGDLGELLIVAPETQQSGVGRSLGGNGEVAGHTPPPDVSVTGCYAVKGTPAATVRRAILTLATRPVSLSISGINYGENVGTGVTVSGTVGAAIEAASLRIPSLAVSVETPIDHHFSHSEDVDFASAALIARQAATLVMRNGLPPGVDVIKIDVPADATSETPWRLTRLTRQRYFESVVVEDANGEKALEGYAREIDWDALEPDSDAHALLVDRVVSICPLTIDLSALEALLASEAWRRRCEADGPGGRLD